MLILSLLLILRQILLLYSWLSFLYYQILRQAKKNVPFIKFQWRNIQPGYISCMMNIFFAHSEQYHSISENILL